MKYNTSGNVRCFILADGALHIRILHEGNWQTPVEKPSRHAGLDDQKRVIQETILVLSAETKQNLLNVLEDLYKKV